MEGDSQEEDETLRNYWTKKKEKKKGREKKKRERRSVSGEAASEDQEAQDKHETTLLDSTKKLTTLTSVNEDKPHTPNNLEGIPPSTLYDSEDDLLDYNNFVSETTSPKPPFQGSQDEDLARHGGCFFSEPVGRQQFKFT